MATRVRFELRRVLWPTPTVGRRTSSSVGPERVAHDVARRVYRRVGSASRGECLMSTIRISRMAPSHERLTIATEPSSHDPFFTSTKASQSAERLDRNRLSDIYTTLNDSGSANARAHLTCFCNLYHPRCGSRPHRPPLTIGPAVVEATRSFRDERRAEPASCERAPVSSAPYRHAETPDGRSLTLMTDGSRAPSGSAQSNHRLRRLPSQRHSSTPASAARDLFRCERPRLWRQFLCNTRSCNHPLTVALISRAIALTRSRVA